MNFVKDTKLVKENNQYYIELFGDKIYIDAQKFLDREDKGQNLLIH